MDKIIIWYLVIGFILVLVGLTTSFFDKLPVTTSIVYFLFGITLGPMGLQIASSDLLESPKFFEHLTEAVVIISLFVAGLKLRLPLNKTNWASTVSLSTISMVITIALVAAFSFYFLKLPWGAGILLGAILAPTDPVLASMVQVKDAEDRDRLRFSLTGEAGLNDGTAFPFVMLGLGLLGFHELGSFGIRWVAIDLIWAVLAGLALGWGFGHAVTRVVLFLRSRNEDSEFLDDFLAIGLIALSYGAAHVINAYGFLAVFTAGLAMRKIEDRPDKVLQAPHKEAKPLAKAVRSFTEQLERIGEVASVILLGAMFQPKYFLNSDLIIIPVLLLLIRPVSVLIGLAPARMGPLQKPFISWFGIRGIGSIYYLTFALSHGLSGDVAHRLVMIVYCTVVTSIFIHGLSGMPMMKLYERSRGR